MADEIDLTGPRETPWSNIPDEGPSISADAAMARAAGRATRTRIVTGISGTGSETAVDYEVDGEGNVMVLTPGYEAVVEDDRLILLRPVPVA